MDKRFQDTGPCSKLLYLGMKRGHWQKFQKFHTYTQYSLSTPQGRNWPYFCSTDSGFPYTGPILKIAILFASGHVSWDMGQFSKLPYLGMKPGKWSNFQKLHIYCLSTPGGRNWAYFRSMGSSFRDTDRFSKFPYLGMKLWPLAKVPEVVNILSFYLRVVAIEQFLLYRQQYPRYRPFFKIAIFGHET